jgi:cytochrome P450
VWRENADEFRPGREVRRRHIQASKGSPAFFPFGWGPRICVGQNFALVEDKLALSMVLQHLSFSLSPSYAHAPFPVSTLQTLLVVPRNLLIARENVSWFLNNHTYDYGPAYRENWMS